MRRIIRVVLSELGATLRGFGGFYARLLSVLLPSAGRLANAVFLGLVVAATILGFYIVPGLGPDAVVNFLIPAGLAVLIAGFAATRYIIRSRPIQTGVARVAVSAVIVLAIIILLGHPTFSGALKVAAGVALLGLTIFAAGRYVRQAGRAPISDRAAIRGQIVGLLPFYIAGVCTLLWGLNQTLPAPAPGQPHYFGHTRPELGYKEVVQPELADGNDPLHEPARTTELDGYSFWAYAIRQVTGVALEGPMEQAYWYVIHPAADGLGVADGWPAPEEFGVWRITTWNQWMDIFDNILLKLLTALFFIGVIADIAANVQRRIQTGQSDMDLTRDHALALLSAVNSAKSTADAQEIEHATAMLRGIQDRAVQMLAHRLEDADVTVRAAAALALERIAARGAAPRLMERWRLEQSERVRSVILRALGRIVPLAAIARLPDALRGEHALIRAAGVTTLARQVGVLTAGDPEDAPAVRADEPPEFARERAAREAARLEQREALLAAAIDALDTADAPTRDAIVAELLRLDSAEARRIAAGRLLGDTAPSDAWRVGAFNLLGRVGDPNDEPRMLNAAGNSDAPAEVRAAALRALGGYPASAAAAQALSEAATEADRADVRAAALVGLARRRRTDGLEALLVGVNDVAERCKIEAVRGLAAVATTLREAGKPIPPEVFAALRRIAGRKADSILRDEACFALAAVGDDQAREVLTANLPDPEATLALGTLRDPATIGSLIEAARQTRDRPVDSLHRIAPIQALGMIGQPAAGALIDLFEMRSADRPVIAAALGKIGGDRATTYLLEQFTPWNQTTAAYLAPALAATGRPEARDALVAALSSPSAAAAAGALADFRDPETLKALLPLLNSYDESVRDAVFGAVHRLSIGDDADDKVAAEMRRYVTQVGATAAGLFSRARQAAGRLAAGVADAVIPLPQAPGGKPETAGVAEPGPGEPVKPDRKADAARADLGEYG
jgi:HEAT repeat protein